MSHAHIAMYIKPIDRQATHMTQIALQYHLQVYNSKDRVTMTISIMQYLIEKVISKIIYSESTAM